MRNNLEKTTKSLTQKKAATGVLFYGIIGILAALTLAALILIMAYILVNGLFEIDLEFLTQEPRKMGKEGGVFSVIIGTIYVTGLAIVIATPIGVAVFPCP